MSFVLIMNRMPADDLLSILISDIFNHDLKSLTPRHVSMLAWCMVKLNYVHQPHVKLIQSMANKICNFMMKIFEVSDECFMNRVRKEQRHRRRSKMMKMIKN
jgi:hypothetical protein